VTTTFFLVRHAAHDRVGAILCGQIPGISLGTLGFKQAHLLAERLAGEHVAVVQSSALERALETAKPIAHRVGLPVEITNAITEIDFGAWSGLAFADLASDPRWDAWNRTRHVGRPPEGETMLEAQTRIVAHLEHLCNLHRGRSVVLVSHGDVIKAALLYHLGLPIDAYARFDIDPASISTLAIGDWGSKVVRMNEVVAA
jgi:probable phosphoglycerate mutase